jgi:regulation of enolase protein 1 (concanavalin A-like superfamily)
MKQRRSTVPSWAVVTLALAMRLPAAAEPPPPPWIAQDIGDPKPPGVTDVKAGVWSLMGGGKDIFGATDRFHYAYQPVRGDGTITARFLSVDGGNAEWAKVGLMVRENVTPGSPNLNFPMTPGHGLHATVRVSPGVGTRSFNEVGPDPAPEPNLFMRLQRAGQDIAGFYSRDGYLWFPADFGPQTLPTLPEEALFGLAISSVSDGDTATGQLDQVSVQTGAMLPYGVQACGSNQSVLLEWRKLPNALGYRIYRGPKDAKPDQLLKLTADAVAGTSFADTAAGLTNGTRVTYAIAAIFPGADGTPVEGPRVAVAATPVGVPPGFLGCSIDEGPTPGSVAYDPSTNVLTLTGSGWDIYNNADQGYFLLQPVEGDFQVTVTILTELTGSRDGAPAGLFFRESLDPSARNGGIIFVLGGGFGLYRQRRTTYGGITSETLLVKSEDLQLPIVVRLTRTGDAIATELSKDDGKTFQPAKSPWTFSPSLPRTLYIGLGASSGVRGEIGTIEFRDLVIRNP